MIKKYLIGQHFLTSHDSPTWNIELETVLKYERILNLKELL